MFIQGGNDIMRGGGNMQQMMKQMTKNDKRKWLKNKKSLKMSVL